MNDFRRSVSPRREEPLGTLVSDRPRAFLFTLFYNFMFILIIFWQELSWRADFALMRNACWIKALFIYSVKIPLPLKKQKQGKSCHLFTSKSFHIVSGLNMIPPGVPGQSRVFILITVAFPAYHHENTSKLDLH